MVQIQYFTRPVEQTDVLGALIGGFDRGRTELKDDRALDAAAQTFGSGGSKPASSNLQALAGATPYSGAAGQGGPFTRPQPAVTSTPAPAPSLAYTDKGRPIDPDTGFLLSKDDPRYAGAWSPTSRDARPRTQSPAVAAIDQVAPVAPTSGIPQGYLASARTAESGGNDRAANPNSSALGRYQFLESTWNGLAQQYPELQLTPDGRTDPAQQERAMARFTQDNASALSGSGIPVNPGTLYAAHFLGAGGAQKVLTADPNSPMSALVDPGVIAANPQLRGMTAGSFAEWANGKGGNTSGGYQPPMQDVGAGQGQPFTPDPETLRTLLASEATRPLAMSLITAQQETEASQGRFVTETGEDGSIWQRDTLTGEQKVIREAPQAAEPMKPIEVGGVLLDPTTYQPIFDSRTTGTPTLPADVQEYQFYADQERAAGREPLSVIEYNQALKGNGLTVTTNPDGTTTVQQGGAPKPLTEGQSKDTVFATRANGALPIVDKLEQSLLSFGENAADSVPFGNYLQSEDYQVARDAGREFLASILRKDTGAAVTPSEEQMYGDMFLPRPGDKPLTVQMKRERRARAVAAIEAGMPAQAILNMATALSETSGAAPSAVPSAPTAPAPGAVASPMTDQDYNALPSGALFIDPDDGQTYRKP